MVQSFFYVRHYHPAKVTLASGKEREALRVASGLKDDIDLDLEGLRNLSNCSIVAESGHLPRGGRLESGLRGLDDLNYL